MSFCALVDGGKTKEARLLLRESMEAGQRLTVWRKILEVRSAGCPQLDTAALYWDTVNTCYEAFEVISMMVAPPPSQNINYTSRRHAEDGTSSASH